ncbi:MAG: cation transporter [Anaerovoracaceae bacterium]|jgi:copper chaperone CopZ
MKKSYKIEVDCASCAAKMEDAINKIEGVQKGRVNFMMQKMTVEADDSRFDEILDQAIRACRRVEPDFSIEK